MIKSLETTKNQFPDYIPHNCTSLFVSWRAVIEFRTFNISAFLISALANTQQQLKVIPSAFKATKYPYMKRNGLKIIVSSAMQD